MGAPLSRPPTTYFISTRSLALPDPLHPALSARLSSATRCSPVQSRSNDDPSSWPTIQCRHSHDRHHELYLRRSQGVRGTGRVRDEMLLLGAGCLLVPRLRLESNNMEPLYGGNGRIQKAFSRGFWVRGGERARVSSGITFFRSLHPSPAPPCP